MCSATSDAALPRRLGKYTLLEKIGEGGMAEVFKARREGPSGFEKILVIKRLLPFLADEPRLAKMFVNEAKLASRLQHRNIVQVLELGESEGELYIAMELVTGLDLSALLDRAEARGLRIPVWFSLHVVSEILSALSFAHEHLDDQLRPQAIIHRDVSPPNVFISATGEVKLADFGVAKAISEMTPHDPNETDGGHLKGKLGYMSPEQVHGESIDPRSDIFAAGVVLWECLTQRPLFSGRADFATMLAICEDPRPPPSRYNPSVSSELDALVLSALEPDRERRPASARALEEALRPFLNRLRPHLQLADVCHVLDVLTGKRASDPVLGADVPRSPEPGGLPKRQRVPSRAPRPLPWEQAGDDVWAPEPPTSLVDDLALPQAPAPLTGRGPPSTISEPAPWETATDEKIEVNPWPFFLRSEGRSLGPLDYREFIAACETETRHAAEIEVSADGQRWLSLPHFARLVGLDYLAPEHRPVLNATLVDTIAQKSLATALATLAHRRETGRFVVTSGAMRREIEVLHGAPTFVYTERADLQLPVLGARREVFPRERVPELVHASLESQLRLEEVARERVGVVLALHRPRLMRDRLTEIFRWRQGRYSFETTTSLEHNTPFASSLLAPLPEVVQRCFSPQELAGTVAAEADRRFGPSELFDATVRGLELSKALQAVAARFANGEPFTEVIRGASADTHRISVVFYLLTHCDALRARDSAR